MGFTIEELLEEILNSPLEKQKKIQLLSRIYKTGQLNRDMFIAKLEGEETLVFTYCDFDENGKRRIHETNYDAKQVVDTYIKSFSTEKPKARH